VNFIYETFYNCFDGQNLELPSWQVMTIHNENVHECCGRATILKLYE